MAGRVKDFFQVELKTPSGHVLPTIEFDAQRWFVAEPGNEFQVCAPPLQQQQQQLMQLPAHPPPPSHTTWHTHTHLTLRLPLRYMWP